MIWHIARGDNIQDNKAEKVPKKEDNTTSISKEENAGSLKSKAAPLALSSKNHSLRKILPCLVQLLWC